MSTTVPRATVEQIATQFRELEALRRRQYATMAEMIRACVATLQTSAANTAAYRRAEGFGARARVEKAHKEDQAKAWLYLLALATSLEDQAGDQFDTSPAPSDT